MKTTFSYCLAAVITLERNYAITHAMHLNKRLRNVIKAISVTVTVTVISVLSSPLFLLLTLRYFCS